MKDAKLTTDCPLTFAQFIPVSGRAQYDNDNGYTVQSVDSNFVFVSSTTRGDNLPLTQFKVEEKPCLDTRDVSVASNAEFYPLEKDRKNTDCRQFKQFHEQYDTRYASMGYSISEYDVQEESEVLVDLNGLPLYSTLVHDENKKNIDYGFWTRPTIAWKLSCDDDHTRQSVVNAAIVESEKQDLNETAVIGLTLAAVLCGFAGTLAMMILYCGGCCARDTWGELPMRLFTGGCIFIMFILSGVGLILVWGQATELSNREESIHHLSYVNECGDMYTTIPDEFLPEIQRAANQANFSLVSLVIVCIINFVSTLSCAFARKGGDDQIEKPESEDGGYQPLSNQER